jgi:hypothetical protein
LGSPLEFLIGRFATESLRVAIPASANGLRLRGAPCGAASLRRFAQARLFDCAPIWFCTPLARTVPGASLRMLDLSGVGF